MLRNAVTRYWQGYLTYGALLVLTGILAIAHWLSFFSMPVALMLACSLIATAMLQLALLVVSRQLPYFVIQLIGVVALLAAGATVIHQQQIGPLHPQHVVLVFLVIDGLTRLIFAIGIRPLTGWWTMAFASGFGVALAAALLPYVPEARIEVVATVAGLHLIISGLTVALVSYLSRPSP